MKPSRPGVQMLETLVSVREYLGTSYHPDVDYVDGQIEERNVGTKSHSKLLRRIDSLLAQLGFASFIETRTRISETRYRVPDVCVYAQEPEEEVFTRPPLLCVEVLSPEDRMSRVQEVVADYLEMGVPTVWVLDPVLKLAYVADALGFRQVLTPNIMASDERIALSLEDVFSDCKLF